MLYKFEQFNEAMKVKFDGKHLEKQGYKLAGVLKSVSQLEKGTEYCVVDPGLEEWNGGYKYLGINDKKDHRFEDTLVPEKDKFWDFSKEDMEDMIKNGEVAFAKSF